MYTVNNTHNVVIKVGNRSLIGDARRSELVVVTIACDSVTFPYKLRALISVKCVIL